MLVVNGPIAKELGINARSGLGPGRDNEANITIGRAFSLCLRNLGYWYPGQMDMDTIGTTRKFVHCIAENQDMSPWQPFHVDQGFGAEESASASSSPTGSWTSRTRGTRRRRACSRRWRTGAPSEPGGSDRATAPSD